MEDLNEPRIRIERILNHSIEKVYEGWTNPNLLMKWYAPEGCTIRFKTIDVKQGGTFHSCISNPEFGDCWVIGEYLQLVRPKKIVQTLVIADENGKAVAPIDAGHDPNWVPKTTLSITLEKMEGNQTRLILEQDVSEKLARKTGAYQSWLSMLDNLENELKGIAMH